MVSTVCGKWRTRDSLSYTAIRFWKALIGLKDWSGEAVVTFWFTVSSLQHSGMMKKLALFLCKQMPSHSLAIYSHFFIDTSTGDSVPMSFLRGIFYTQITNYMTNHLSKTNRCSAVYLRQKRRSINYKRILFMKCTKCIVWVFMHCIWVHPA